MSDRIDRKLQQVAIAKFRHRHEADFAAGFLAEAGIPYRLQYDDAGGADLGLSALRPSVLWVRAMDEERARRVLAHDVPEEEEEGDADDEDDDDEHAPWRASVPSWPPGDAADEEAAGADPRRGEGSARPGARAHAGRRPHERLGGAERALALVIAGVAAGAAEALEAPSLPALVRVGLPGSVALVFAAAALAGRAPGPVRRLLRALAGLMP